jgi:hypothetical protein
MGTAYATLKVPPDEWQPMVETASGYIMYLDKSDIKYSENGNVEFWIKTVTGHGNYDKSNYEINCAKNTYTIHFLMAFNKQGDIVDAEMSQEPKWYKIAPNSSIESIKKRVCRR